MSNATVTLKAYPYPQGLDNSQHRIHILGLAVVSASPATYVAGGIPLTWQFISSLTGNPDILNTNATAPIMAYFTSLSGSGYVYTWNKSTNTLRIWQSAGAAAPLAELTGGAAIPAGVSGDSICVEAQFVRASL